MEITLPHIITSPPGRFQKLSLSENDVPNGRVPGHQTVKSVTQPPGSPTKLPRHHTMASPRYIKQFNTLMEHQREVHSEERALWHAERQELYEKITQLEASLRRYQVASSRQVIPPIDKLGLGSGSSRSLPIMDSVKDTSASVTGDEVWRGPKTDVQPTRIFSDSFDQFAKPDGRLSSIAEDVTSRDKVEMRGWILSPNRVRPREAFRETQAPVHKPRTGAELDKGLDGINFRSSSLTPATAKNIMTPQSPSPPSPSPSLLSPRALKLPRPGLGVLEDQYTKDAGHTPLPRYTSDGALSTHSSDPTTPLQPPPQLPPLEPQPTRVRRPSERSDSYFPVTDDTPHDPDPDPDPALIGPLGLTNNKTADHDFLNELNSKLAAAASSQSLEPHAVAGAADDGGVVEGKEEGGFEREPKLRIKRSMNFGSAFGAKSCGRGV